MGARVGDREDLVAWEQVSGRTVHRIRRTGLSPQRVLDRLRFVVKAGAADLDALVEHALVDAYDEYEQVAAFHSVIEDNLAVPFRTTVLGVEVTVTKVDLLPGSGIVAVCRRGRDRQAIGILDLPLPSPPPDGAEWVEAYRHWTP